jgi:hypothetical protein
MNDLDLAKQLQLLEEELLRADVRHDPQRLGALIADDFREFGTSGRVFDKPSILAELAKEPPAELSLTDFACHQVTPDVALVTYRSQRTDPAGTRRALRSSLWIHRDGRWQIVFHQGTRT